MTEEDAREWMRARFCDRAAERMVAFVRLLREESKQQNLIAAQTFDTIWGRHVVDSAQLVEHAPAAGTWLDIGTGAGFPGLVVAIVRRSPMVLAEPRRRRAEFLVSVVKSLALDHVDVLQKRVEQIDGVRPAIISARAVASTDAIFEASRQVCTADTLYILPRGRSLAAELEELPRRWHGAFHVKHSVTDPASGILIAQQVRRR